MCTSKRKLGRRDTECRPACPRSGTALTSRIYSVTAFYGLRRKVQMNADTLVITAARAATIGASRTSILRLQRSPLVPYLFSIRNRKIPIRDHRAHDGKSRELRRVAGRFRGFPFWLMVGAGLFAWGTDFGEVALAKSFALGTTSALTILFVWGTTD